MGTGGGRLENCRVEHGQRKVAETGGGVFLQDHPFLVLAASSPLSRHWCCHRHSGDQTKGEGHIQGSSKAMGLRSGECAQAAAARDQGQD